MFIFRLYSPPNSLTVNVISFLFPSFVACIIKSTLILASESFSNNCAAIPGLSGIFERLNTAWFSNTSRQLTVFVNYKLPLFSGRGWI